MRMLATCVRVRMRVRVRLCLAGDARRALALGQRLPGQDEIPKQPVDGSCVREGGAGV